MVLVDQAITVGLAGPAAEVETAVPVATLPSATLIVVAAVTSLHILGPEVAALVLPVAYLETQETRDRGAMVALAAAHQAVI